MEHICFKFFLRHHQLPGHEPLHQRLNYRGNYGFFLIVFRFFFIQVVCP